MFRQQGRVPPGQPVLDESDGLSSSAGRNRGIDSFTGSRYYSAMIETFSFLFGLGFSFLVYFSSIKKANLPAWQKAFYFLISLIGITGMLFLSGVLIAHTLRKHHLL